MNNIRNMIWIEWRKAVRSRIPLWTTIGALFLPVVVGLMILVSKNPEISRKLGVISAKADLIGLAATEWPGFLILIAQMLATAGFFMFIVILSWMFGREFADGTAKDLLAVPVPRMTILLGKFLVYIGWAFIMALLILCGSLLMGTLVGLPGGGADVIREGLVLNLVTTLLVILSVIPFALLASVGRGYLLPLSMAIITMIVANVAIALGWGDLFPWSIPGLFSQGTGMVGTAGVWVVVITGLAGWFCTDVWWKRADQNK